MKSLVHRPKWDRSKGAPEPVRALDRIVERDNGEPLVFLADVAPSVKLLRPQVIAYLRHTVAEMLERACRSLPDGFGLGVIDAWRPLERQRRIYEWMTKCVQEVWPDMPAAAVRRKVNRFVAPWDRKAPPGHCTGGAVDVNLLGPDGEPVDVMSPYERFQAAPTYVYGLSPEAQRNRLLLVSTMETVGFSNCRDEWWHYSYGDAGWAVRTGRSECLYGKIDLDPSVYEEAERLWLEAFAERKNPYLE